ncbi:MAG: PEP-utilizing enzyme [Candidatus Micrarchaeota archaeon]
MTPEEIAAALRGKSEADAREIDERIRHSCWLFEAGEPIKIFTGAEAQAIYAQVFEEKPAGEVRELRGTPSSPGYAKGVVKIITRIEDIPKMNQGDILISPATNPNLVPAMKKAAAIVTDEGGITCHAAIVSRELGVPCVVGTKIVTKAFKDGDLVEVDANKGIIRKVD